MGQKMIQTDPWADVRERDDDSDYRDLNGYIDRLLTDADALLELKEYAGHIQECEMLTQGVRGICHCGFTKALAALPEHLRGDPNERSRKA